MTMQIEPALMPLMAALAGEPPDDIAQERAREAAIARSAVGTFVRPVPDTVAFVDELIESADASAPVRVRIYRPAGAEPRAGLLYLHGGGWSTGSIETAHEHCGTLAADADVVVVSVEYRLLPEHVYPAGLDDCFRALGWVAENADRLGIDPQRLAVGGGSAGGNLAAAIALRARDLGGPPIALQLLEIPVLDLTLGSPSYAEVGAQFPVLAAAGDLIRQRYLTEGVDPRDPYVSPLLAADLTGLPPAVLLACEIDPVRDDGIRYAERLTAAGVAARAEVFPGLIHGTQELTLVSPQAVRFQAACVAALRAL